MACEDLQAALATLTAQYLALEQVITSAPPQDQAALRAESQAQLNKINGQIQTASAALNNCLQAVSTAPRKVAGAQPQSILTTQYQNPNFGTSNSGWGSVIANGSFPSVQAFPLSQGLEWKQVTNTTSEYDTTPAGATGWAVFPDLAGTDFMFTHPFGLDWEFLCALDQQYYNLCSHPENLSLAVAKGGDEVVAAKFSQLRMQFATTEDVYANVGSKGFLGVEWENGLVPSEFQVEFTEGDRVAVFGRWIVDVGEDSHTEIHPPLLLASASVYATPATTVIVNPLSPKGVQYTRALFTSRAYLSGQTFLEGRYPNADIYKDGASDDGHFLQHMLVELEKLDSILQSSSLEAHPKIKQNPFQGPHILPVIVRTTQPRPQVSMIGQGYVVSFHFTVRTGCTVEVVKNDESSVCVYVILNSVGYTPPPLPSRKALQVTVAEIRSNSGAYAALIGNAVLFPLAGLFSSSGIETDQYELPIVYFTLGDSPGAMINVPLDSLSALPDGQGISTDDSQPFPVLGWLEVGWGGTGTPLATTGNPVATITPVFDLNGVWASGGTAGPIISVNGNSISVDMSAYKRPAAQGSIVDSSNISVTFPDDKTYTGTLELPGTIVWSNNSSWTKLPTGTSLFDLNGRWVSGGTQQALISVSGNVIAIDMSAYQRPAAQGFVVDSSRIVVAFPDDKAYFGKLQLPGTIVWSNNSTWTKASPIQPVIKTLMDLNGTWASGGTPGPVISVSGTAISVDMSAYKRPNARGSVVDASNITLTFPDDKAYTGKLQLPGTILWSNNSTWTKVG